jgi:hypothetical protein
MSELIYTGLGALGLYKSAVKLTAPKIPKIKTGNMTGVTKSVINQGVDLGAEGVTNAATGALSGGDAPLPAPTNTGAATVVNNGVAQSNGAAGPTGEPGPGDGMPNDSTRLGKSAPTEDKTGTGLGGLWQNNKGLMSGLGIGAGVLGLGALSGNKMGIMGGLGTLGLLGGAGWAYDKLGGWDNIKQLGGGGWGQMMSAKDKSEAFAKANPKRWNALQSLPSVKGLSSNAGMLGRARNFLEMNPEQKGALAGDKVWENLAGYEADDLTWALGLGDRLDKAPEGVKEFMMSRAGAPAEGHMGMQDMMTMAKDKPILALQNDKFNNTLRGLVDRRGQIDQALGFKNVDQLRNAVAAKDALQNVSDFADNASNKITELKTSAGDFLNKYNPFSD